MQAHAYEAQRLARVSADLFREAEALEIEAIGWTQLGNYKHSLSLCNRARHLIQLCGMAHSDIDHSIMNQQAEMHKLKSEYKEAYEIHTEIVQKASVEQNTYSHAFALLNLAEISVHLNAPQDDVQRNIERAREIFQMTELVIEVTMCDTIFADLCLREGKNLTAIKIFERCLKFAVGNNSDLTFYCLERLGDVSRWTDIHLMSGWTVVFLARSLTSKHRLGIHKALQFLGDVFLSEGDEATAITLFTVALEGFTEMDIHCSRAECMFRLGTILKGHNNLLKAGEFWDMARPLFEKSSQLKQVEIIDERLASTGKDVLQELAT
jgi:tetratricopeptide (TPR) repeat protein